MPVRLLVKSKAEPGDPPPEEVLVTEDLVTIGRDKTCKVVLNNPSVSRKHLHIVREGALYFLEDMNSSFGTRVNGATLPAGEKRLLRNGDIIAVGPFDLIFDRVNDAVAAAETDEETSLLAKRVIKDALKGLASGETPYLRIMNGSQEGKRIDLKDAQEIVIGRDDKCEVKIEDDLVSRKHCKIRRDWSGTQVEDLKSRNGIRVNRKKVKTVALKDRDELEVGSTRFLYLDPSEVREDSAMGKPAGDFGLDDPEAPAEEPAAEAESDAASAAEEAAAAAPEQAAEEPAAEEEEAASGEEGEASEGDEESSASDELSEGGEDAAEPEPSEPPEPPADDKAAIKVAGLTVNPKEMLPVFLAIAAALCAVGILLITFFGI